MTALGGALFLVKIGFAALVGYLAWLIFGANWLVESVCTYLFIGIVFATIDLFDSRKKKLKGGPCPYCGGKLRTQQARQCPHCKMSWHKQSQSRPSEN